MNRAERRRQAKQEEERRSIEHRKHRQFMHGFSKVEAPSSPTLSGQPTLPTLPIEGLKQQNAMVDKEAAERV